MKERSFVDVLLAIIGVFFLAVAGSLLVAKAGVYIEGIDKESYVDGLIAFTTSATLAVFLTLFHSDKKRVALFRDYTRAAGTVYLTLIVNTFLVVAVRLFVSSTGQLFGTVGIDNFVTVFATLLTIQVMAYLVILLNLYMKS